MRLHKSGFTLLEILTVVAIIALLVALILPVLNSARAKARDSSCITNLHQVYITWRNYVEDYLDYPPSLVSLISQANASIFHCPSDSWQGFNVWATRRSGHAASYFYVHSISDRNRRELIERADPHHGILFCALHADYNRESVERAYRKFSANPDRIASSIFPYPPVLWVRCYGLESMALYKPRASHLVVISYPTA